MTGISKLKDEARKYEQREEWEKAIKAYQQVLADAEGGEIELPLYNRVGDLYVRLGRQEEAVRSYEQAADRYAEAGLYNNAIALCNKALRYVPGRLGVLRRLGQYSASQGFLTDARTYLLQFAEKAIAGGDTTAALGVLTDYANLSGDAEVREFIGRKLHTLGRTAEALPELKRAYALRLGAGEQDAATNLRREILSLDPGAFDDEAGGAPQPETPQAMVLPIHAAQLPDLPEAPLAAPLAREPEPPGLDELEPEAPPVTVPLEGFELTALVPEAPGDAEPEELAGLETSNEFEAGSGDLPLLDGLETPVGSDLAAGAGLPRLDLMEDQLDTDLADLGQVGAGSDFDLPLLHDGLETVAGPEPLPLIGDLPLLEEPLPEQAGPLPELPDLTSAEAGPALPELEDVGVADLPALPEAEDEEPAEDTSPLPELEDAWPAEVGSPLSEMEVAEPAEDGSPLPELEDAEPAEDASPLPELEDAEPAEDASPLPLLGGTGPAADKPKPEYVDLRALLLEDQPPAGTRFRVGELLPTGDEDDDFAELLSRFKQHVAENVDPADAAAHYDLGLAFKDMGLLDEAIGELQVALHAGHMRLKVVEELGLCFLLKGEYSIAEKVLRRALDVGHDDELELLGVYYHLGRAYEGLGKPELARDAYERVLALDINFGDVSERIARL